MPSRNIKSKQLKKRVKNYRPTPAKFLWPELSFSIVYSKNMKKNKISPTSSLPSIFFPWLMHCYIYIQSYGILKTVKTSNLKAHNNEKMAIKEKEPYFKII